ncbi:MAG: alpha/beta fold hydrolase [Sphaerochaetaceae bacterium]
MKKRYKIFLLILILTLALVGAFFIYASDYYKADKLAIAGLNNEKFITVDKNLTILTPEKPSETALIFYPGAKVEAIAYLPILEKLRKNGITCILVKMPFNMAIFNQKAADKVFDKLPNIKNWYIGGHSMGGAMASSYAANNKEKVEGLILLGAYIYGELSPEDAITIYGTFNSNLEKNIDYTENVIIIDGGNHAQFGNYGKQKGDPDATISSEEQQNIAVEAILEFIKTRDSK